MKPLAANAPNRTCVAPVKPAPLMTTAVPPVSGPCDGLTPVTETAEPMYENCDAGFTAVVPAGVTTVTLTKPPPGGVTARICVSLSTTSPVAACAPKFTAVAPVKPEPCKVTAVPPAAGPLDGITPVTCGPLKPPEPLAAMPNTGCVKLLELTLYMTICFPGAAGVKRRVIVAVLPGAMSNGIAGGATSEKFGFDVGSEISLTVRFASPRLKMSNVRSELAPWATSPNARLLIMKIFGPLSRESSYTLRP